jgi:hypothetical protein
VAATAAVPAASGAPLLRAVAFDTVAKGDGASSSLTKPDDLVIRSKARWRDVWNQLNAGVQTMPPTGAQYPPPPAVDFRRSMLLVVLQGQRGSGGHSIAVTRVSKLASQLVVRVEERSPGAGCMTAAVMTAPYHVVRVPRSNRSVVFTHRQSTYGCG